MIRIAVTIGVAILLLVAPVASVAGGGTTTLGSEATSNSQHNVLSSDEIELTDSVTLWERALLPLRANVDNAETTLKNQGLFLRADKEIGANRETVGVFGTGEIELAFGHVTGATTSAYNGENVSLVVGKVDSDVTVDEFELIESLRRDDLDSINENITFRSIESGEIKNGEFVANYTADESGRYVSILATTGNGSAIEVDNDDLVINEQTTVIGLESFLVHDSRSTVSTTDAEPGDDVTFHIDTNLDNSAEVDHAVVLYAEDTFTGSMTTINTTEDLDSSLSSGDLRIEHDIAAVNGITDLQTDIEQFGLTAETKRHAGSTSVDDIIAVAANTTGFDDPESIVTDDIQLDASATTIGDADSEDVTVTVETLGNWSETQYRWVHIATTDDTEQFATNTGTIDIEEVEEDDCDDESDDDDQSPLEPEFVFSEPDIDRAKIAVGESVTASVTVRNIGNSSGNITVPMQIDGETVDTRTVLVTEGTEETVTFTTKFDEPGKYSVEIGDLEIGTVTVDEPSAQPEPATFELRDVALSETDVTTGDPIDVTATVENVGAESGTYTVELRVDGTVAETKDVSLKRGTAETVTFTETFDEADEYEIAINDVDAGTVTVTEPDDGTSGFGVISAFAAVLIALYTKAIRSMNAP